MAQVATQITRSQLTKKNKSKITQPRSQLDKPRSHVRAEPPPSCSCYPTTTTPSPHPPSSSSCPSFLPLPPYMEEPTLPPLSSLLTNKSRLLTCEGRPLTCKVRAGRSHPSCSSLLPPAPPSSLPPAAPSPLLPLPPPPSALTCKSRPLHVRTNPWCVRADPLHYM